MNLLEAVNAYEMPPLAQQLVTEHPPMATAGPTGSGKSTLSRYLTQIGNYAPSVSDTTRDPRGSEVNGIHYWFITKEQALERLEAGYYVEGKMVHDENFYGTSIDAYQTIVDAGRLPVLDIDYKGIKTIMAVVPSFRSIFLLPPSFEVWQQRLDNRGDLSLDDKRHRFHTALIEFDSLLEDDRFYPVINTEVVETADIIISKSYHENSYRQHALQLAVELRTATQTFLDQAA